MANKLMQENYIMLYSER